MVGTEFLNGQGLGNQLFCYVSTRCIAIDNNYSFGTAGQKQFANNIHSNKGMYFMDVELGEEMIKNKCSLFYEKEDRLLLPYDKHDSSIGVYISGEDTRLTSRISDNTLIYGNLQSEKYFLHHKEEIKKWLKINNNYFDKRFSNDNTCILNMRGGEYVGNRSLYLKKKYWVDAMNIMKQIKPDMNFIIITEDVKNAKIMFPKLPVYHLGMGEDYAAIHFAHYLILSNSSFAFFPTFTSDTVKFVIAPKYWARHNISDGYWASEQNIYSGWNYLDRNGQLFSAEECRAEYDNYKKTKLISNMNNYKKPRWYAQIYYYKLINMGYRIYNITKRLKFVD